MNFIDRHLAKSVAVEGTVKHQGYVETLDDNQNNNTKPSYREQIANGTLVEVSLDEI